MFARRQIVGHLYIQEMCSLRLQRQQHRRFLSMLWEEGYPDYYQTSDLFNLRRLFGEPLLRVELEDEDWGQ